MEVTVAIAALLMVSLLIQREVLPRLQSDAADAPIRPVQASAVAPALDRALAPGDGAIPIVVFTDFQCVTCAGLHAQLIALMRRHGTRLSVSYRHLPSTVHPLSVSAANAAECAAHQDRFVEFSEALFESQHWIGIDDWEQFRRAASVPDSSAFAACVGDRNGLPRIREDVSIARSAGVTGTPTVILPGMLLSGSGLDELERHVMRLVDAKGSR